MFIVVVLHELTHAMTKFLFGDSVITPIGLGNENNRHGESGWELERNLFGGDFLGEWKQEDCWDMKKLHRLVFEKDELSTWDLSEPC